MKTFSVSLVVLAASLTTSVVATPISCGAVSNMDVTPSVPVRFVLGLGKREARGGDAETGNSGNVNGGDVDSESDGGDQENDGSSGY